jgi:hypothetical protein
MGDLLFKVDRLEDKLAEATNKSDWIVDSLREIRKRFV